MQDVQFCTDPPPSRVQVILRRRSLVTQDGMENRRSSRIRGYSHCSKISICLLMDATLSSTSSASASRSGEIVLSFRAWCSSRLPSCLSASIIGFNATFMIALLLNGVLPSRTLSASAETERVAKLSITRSEALPTHRVRTLGTGLPLQEQYSQMMADDALHVCPQLLTVSVSPIPYGHRE